MVHRNLQRRVHVDAGAGDGPFGAGIDRSFTARSPSLRLFSVSLNSRSAVVDAVVVF